MFINEMNWNWVQSVYHCIDEIARMDCELGDVDWFKLKSTPRTNSQHVPAYWTMLGYTMYSKRILIKSTRFRSPFPRRPTRFSCLASCLAAREAICRSSNFMQACSKQHLKSHDALDCASMCKSGSNVALCLRWRKVEFINFVLRLSIEFTFILFTNGEWKSGGQRIQDYARRLTWIRLDLAGFSVCLV